VTARLSAATLDRRAGPVRRPGYDFSRLAAGHRPSWPRRLHRAHQAAFTEDAILPNAETGRNCVSFAAPRHRRSSLSAGLPLHTVEMLSEAPQYRIIGVVRRPPPQWLNQPIFWPALAAPEIHVISLTVTEKGLYSGAPRRLEESHPDIYP